VRPLRLFLDARKARDFGIGRYILGLTKGLVDTGNVSLTALCRPGDASLLPPGTLIIDSTARPYGVRELLSLGRVAARAAVDVVHWPHYVVPIKTPAPTVVTIHDLMHLTQPEHRSPAKRLYAGWMLLHAIRKAAAVIAVSGVAARQIAETFPEARGKLQVVSNGIDPVFFSASTADVAARLGIRGPYLLYCGNDKPHKNLPRLFEAFALFRRQYPDFELVLAGVPAATASSRHSRAKELGIFESLREPGFVADADLAALMAGATVFVLPSLVEGFGLPLVEAMAAGAPVACSNRDALTEVAGGAARLFDPENPSDMAAALSSLAGSPDARAELRAKGRARALSFTWGRAARETLEIYQKVAGRRE
jgi:glycosyltransferase involved in cell wall biosynthesis